MDGIDLLSQLAIVSVEAKMFDRYWDKLVDLAEPLYNHNERMYDHSMRVALYAAAIAKASMLDVKFAIHGGWLHDIGKITIPNSTLDAEEWDDEKQAAIESHAQAGFDYLYPTHPWSAYVAGCHHRYQDHVYGVSLQDIYNDTKVYNDATEIMRMTSIVAHADTFDALTSRIPYYSPEEAAQIITKNGLSMFRTDICVDVFYRLGFNDEPED